jgi:crotonobetainyl-CoA:carnitine CoA-transferase CaiB-like acyl-CoA transferase
MIVEVTYPVAGPVKLIGIPFTLLQSPGATRGLSPFIGQHSFEILRELGYDDSEITKMNLNGLIKLPD